MNYIIHIIGSSNSSNNTQTTSHPLPLQQLPPNPCLNRLIQHTLIQLSLSQPQPLTFQQRIKTTEALFHEAYYHIKVVQRRLGNKRKNNYPKFINQIQILSHSFQQSVDQMKLENLLKQFLLRQYAVKMKLFSQKFVGNVITYVQAALGQVNDDKQLIQDSHLTQQLLTQITKDTPFAQSQPTTNQQLEQVNNTILNVYKQYNQNQRNQTILLQQEAPDNVNSDNYQKLFLLSYQLAKAYYTKGLLPKSSKFYKNCLGILPQLSLSQFQALLIQLIVQCFRIVIYLRMNLKPKVLHTHQLILGLMNRLKQAQSPKISIELIKEGYLQAISLLMYKVHSKTQMIKSFRQALQYTRQIHERFCHQQNPNIHNCSQRLPRPYTILKLQSIILYLQKDFQTAIGKMGEGIEFLIELMGKCESQRQRILVSEELIAYCLALSLCGLWKLVAHVSVFILKKIRFKFRNQFNQVELGDSLESILKHRQNSNNQKTIEQEMNSNPDDSQIIDQNQALPKTPNKYYTQNQTKTAQIIANSIFYLAESCHELQQYTKSLILLQVYHKFILSQHNQRILQKKYVRAMSFYEIDAKVFKRASQLKNIPSIPRSQDLNLICRHVFKIIFQTLRKIHNPKYIPLINFLFFYKALEIDQIVFYWQKVMRLFRVIRKIQTTLSKYEKLFSLKQKSIYKITFKVNELLIKKCLSYMKSQFYPKCLIIHQSRQSTLNINNRPIYRQQTSSKNDQSVSELIQFPSKPDKSILQTFILHQMPLIKGTQWKSYQDLECVLGDFSYQTEVLMLVKGILIEKKNNRKEVRDENERMIQTEEDYFMDTCLKLEISGKARANNR